jgi:hypothetical protein
MVTKPAVIRQSTSYPATGREDSKMADKGIVVLKSGNREFRTPSRMGKDSFGY